MERFVQNIFLEANTAVHDKLSLLKFVVSKYK